MSLDLLGSEAHASSVFRQLILLMALVAACAAPPSLSLALSDAGIEAARTPTVGCATLEDESGSEKDALEDADVGPPPFPAWPAARGRGQHWSSLERWKAVAVDPAAGARRDQRREIRKRRPSMTRGRDGEADAVAS